MNEFEIVSAETAEDSLRGSRSSPARRMLDSLPEGYLTYDEMAKRYGVHTETMRRLCKSKDNNGDNRVKAPSDAIRQGGLVIYLFNSDDVEELDAYYRSRGRVIRG